jgi:uncharacterized membrane protein (DUF106 family)
MPLYLYDGYYMFRQNNDILREQLGYVLCYILCSFTARYITRWHIALYHTFHELPPNILTLK